ncbi:hypothetical protein QR680_003179 [Steinernema hermaphroditum]|uniref:Major facilitator superfamily (MFS) profile domain-containing protein n=1 Tax=Steinernema hermaphroditum TaxID=289476 RepID=A0AA39LJL2_9BILA|nr:hypothetical protein QR680_003179 [Steinernema hermaphroditum]
MMSRRIANLAPRSRLPRSPKTGSTLKKRATELEVLRKHQTSDRMKPRPGTKDIGPKLVKIPFTSLELKREILITYALSIFYNVAFFLQMMITPYVSKQLQISDTEFGYVQTFFGFTQMVGGPLFGYYIKQNGIHKALSICYAATLLSSLILWFSQSFTHMMISRIPCLFMHGQQGHQTLLSALTSPGKERTNAFGRMGLTFGLGFMFAPIFSTLSSKLIHEKAPLLVSVVVSSAAIVILRKCLHNIHEHIDEEENVAKHFNLKTAITTMNRPNVWNVFLKKNIAIAPMHLIFAILQVHMINKFGMTQTGNSVIQMITGVCIMCSNGFGIIWLRKHYREQTLMTIGAICFALAYLQLTSFFSFWQFPLIMPCIAFGMSIVATVADSLMTAYVPEDEHGVVLGVASSVNSLARTIAPAAAGYMLDSFGFGIFGCLGLICTTGVMLGNHFLPVPDTHHEEERKEK